MRKIFLAVVTAVSGLLGVAQPANAECSASGCYAVTVTQIQLNTAGTGLWVQTSGTETLANCTPNSGVFLQLPSSVPQWKEVYAALLAAKLGGALIDIVIKASTNPCTIAYVNL